MKKMTVSIFAVIHGGDEPLAASETWEAETADDLVQKHITFLRGMADDLEQLLKEKP